VKILKLGLTEAGVISRRNGYTNTSDFLCALSRRVDVEVHYEAALACPPTYFRDGHHVKTPPAIPQEDLPEMCAAYHCTTGGPIVIKHGVAGFEEAPGLDVAAFNACRGVGAAQVEAMEHGALFGWE
jgi:hypothetical protein